MSIGAEDLILALGLLPHPEGGYYRESFRAEPLPFELPERGSRAASTAIYFLLKSPDFSAFHRVRSDEVWHHYLGAPLELHTLGDAGHALTRLGPNVLDGERPQAVVTAGVLQAARVAAPGFTLCGCTVAPGFDFADFELVERATLIARYPREKILLETLTRG